MPIEDIRRLRRRLPAIAGLLLVAAALAACSGGGSQAGSASAGPASSQAATGGSSQAASASGGTANIYMVGGTSVDPFFSTVKRGAEDAAKAMASDGATLHYLALSNYNNLGPDAAKLTETAISNKASMILVPDWVPASENPAIKQAISAGIPVLLYNSGASQTKVVGAQGYIGADDYTSGVAGGEYFAQHGVKNVLCVNTVPGAGNEEARCKGISDGAAKFGGKSTELELPSTSFGNPTAVAQAIKAALLKNTSIQGLVTISQGDADSAASGLSQAGLAGKVKLATFDLSTSNLGRIKAGTEMFAIDQQGYLQGYYSVSEAYQFLSYGLQLPESQLLTGPLLVTSANIGQALGGTEAGVR
jgi:simple sugar transport system substrate-binding protein